MIKFIEFMPKKFHWVKKFYFALFTIRPGLSIEINKLINKPAKNGKKKTETKEMKLFKSR